MREFTARKPRGEAEVLHSGAAKSAAPPVEKIAVEIKTAADESAAVRAGHNLALKTLYHIWLGQVRGNFLGPVTQFPITKLAVHSQKKQG